MSLAKLTKINQNEPDVLEAMHEATRRLALQPDVLEVKLFGSFATNLQNATSDIDLAVIIADTANLNKTSTELRKLLRGIGWPIDLVVVPLSKYLAKSTIGGVCFDIREDGIAFYPEWNFY